MPNPGDRFDRYTVIRPIASGGMADVYLVRHELLQTEHALKVLHLSGPGLTQRLLFEGRIQAQLRHPNVVAVSDVIDVDGAPALVMEYVDGPDLGRWLLREQPDLKTAERLFRGIVAGVGAAHDAGVIHRDLNPANVLLAPGPEGPTPKVVDFGLVKAIDGDREHRRGQTKAGTPMGTPGYMAPEQVRSAATVDRRADIWSLGCVLYRLVAHREPFPGEDPFSVLERVASGRCEPIPAEVPGRIARTIARCLSLDPDDRPTDWRAVLDLLDAPPPPLPRPPRRASALWLAVPGLLAAMIGPLVVWLLLPEPPSETLAPAASPTGPPVCSSSGGLLGHTRAPWVFDRSVGDTWTLDAPAEVGALPSGAGEAGEVACVLAAGTRVRLVEAPVRVGDRDWIAIYGEALGPGEAAREEGVIGERCEGPEGQRIGWALVQTRLLGKRPREGDTWQIPSARQVFADAPQGGGDPDAPVCALRAGAELRIQGTPTKHAQREWWVPVVSGALVE